MVMSLSHLGFSINVEKSSLIPLQTAVYLGIRLDSVSMRARLADHRVASTLSLACMVYNLPHTTVDIIMRLLGSMASASVVVPLGLLYT